MIPRCNKHPTQLYWNSRNHQCLKFMYEMFVHCFKANLARCVENGLLFKQNRFKHTPLPARLIPTSVLCAVSSSYFPAKKKNSWHWEPLPLHFQPLPISRSHNINYKNTGNELILVLGHFSRMPKLGKKDEKTRPSAKHESRSSSCGGGESLLLMN